MTIFDILNYVFIVGFALLGWFARTLWGATRSLASDLAMLRNELFLNYIRKDDFKEFRNEVMRTLQRIEGKLDTKQDKL